MSTTLIQNTPTAVPTDLRIALVGLGRAEISAELARIGIEPKKIRMRTKQIFHWIYNYGVTSFDQMTNIAKPLRKTLEREFHLERPEVVERLISVDGTRKYLIRMSPGVEVESVFIPDVSKTGALCVSSQVGCTLTCTFCHTGTQRLVRNLTAREIVLQVIIARDDLGEWPTTQENRKLTNIVFMGMGEPMLNLDAVIKAIQLFTNPDYELVGRRRITVSTSGVIPGIRRMAEERLGVKLAISLHVTTDGTRSKLMPINRKFNLSDLLASVEAYYRATRRPITYEYILFDGLNDSSDDARRLARIARRVPSKVNIIPFHPIDFTNPEGLAAELRAPAPETFDRFVALLRREGAAVMVRSSSGLDIDAACGQLAIKHGAERLQEV